MKLAPGSREVTFERLKQFHVEQVTLRKEQRLFKGIVSPAAVAAMVAAQNAEAALVEGRTVACGGILDETEGRGRAWALIGENVPRWVWPPIVERMRLQVEAALHPETGWAHRVSAETIYDWAPGHRLLLHIGMSLEGLHRGAYPGGKASVSYARVRPGVDSLPVRWRALLGTAARCLWEDSLGAPLSGRERG